ncbi:MAG: class I SAM-dependent methyltransferase [Candidatus Omnitrophota bacterium]
MDKTKYFQNFFKASTERDKVWKVISAYLQRYIPGSSKVLDMGAGYCGFINNIKAKEKHAIDVFKDIEKYASKDVITHKRSVVDIDNLDPACFDVVFASNVFEHLSREDLERLLPKIKKILKPEGRLIIIQPNFRYSFKVYFYDYTHKEIYTADSLCAFLEEFGFNIEIRKDRFLPYTMDNKIPKVPFLVRLYLIFPIKFFGGQMLLIARIDKKEGR